MPLDELVLLLVSCGIVSLTWGQWFWVRRSFGGLRLHERPIGLPATTTALAVAGLLVATWHGAKVAGVPGVGMFILVHFVASLALVGLGTVLLGARGLSVRSLVLEHHNPAGTRAIAGAVPACLAAVAGAFFGDTPAWWATLFQQVLGLGGLVLAWLAVDHFTQLADRITESRLAHVGWRTGGWTFAVGLVSGRASAGDWTSAPEVTTRYGMLALGVLALTVCEIVLEKRLQRRRRSAPPNRWLNGYGPGLVYVGAAAGYLLALGPVG